MNRLYLVVLYIIIQTSLLSGQSLSITAGSVTAFNGDSVTVPVTVSNFYGVGAVTVKIQIDTTVLQWGRALNWSSTLSGALAGRIKNQIILAWDGVNGANIGNGALVELKFKYVSGSSPISFTVSQCEITDTVGNILQVSYINGNVSQTPVPVQPLLVSPQNNAQNQPVNIRLDWSDVTNATSYRIQAAIDTGFSNIVIDQSNILTSYYDVSSLMNNKTYYWRVNAVNPTGTGNWSAIWNFTTIVSTPGPPVLVSPANGSLDNPTAFSFLWRKVNEATNYYFQLSNDSLFTSVVTSDSLLTDTTKSISGLQYNHKYYWRVKSKNSAGNGIWSTIWSFSTVYKYSLNGTLRYANVLQSSLTGVKIYLLKNSIAVDSTTTSANGGYSFSNLLSGTYKLLSKTDKVWGGVNSTDALLIRRFSSGLITFNSMQQNSADVNLTGNVNTTDALDIRRRVVAQINSFSAGDWYFEDPSIVVNTANITRDYSGIVVGDVNGSYDPSLMKISNCTLTEFSDKIVKVKQGEEFLYPLKFSSTGNIGAITLEINYSRENLEFLGLESKIEGLVYNDVDGKIMAAWDNIDGQSFTKQEAFVSLRFKLKSVTGKPDISLGSKCEIADVQGRVIKDLKINIDKLNEQIPNNYLLKQNYPNPFNPETIIEYDLPEQSFVKLEVFNILGEKVITCVNEQKEAGAYKVKFSPYSLTSGVYFYRLEITGRHSNFMSVKKMVYQK